MKAGEVDHFREKLQLFESSKDFAWVKWVDATTISILETSPTFPVLKPNINFSLESAISPNDLDQVIGCFSSETSENTNIQFTLLGHQKQNIRIACLAKRIDGEVYGLWSILPEDSSISMLQTAAHDMRSPINSIMGMLNVIKQLCDDQDTNKETIKEYLGLMEKCSYQALDLTSDILELATIESDHFTLHCQPVVLEDFLGNYINTHRLLTLKKKIKIQLHSNSKAKVSINESKLTRVMDNLITNSVKFSPQGSTIDIRLMEENGVIKVKIKDEGVGMSQEMINTIFEKFGKSRRIGLDGETSHGLGMSIVKQIMELHNGNIHIESEEGAGTEATLIFKKYNHE